ncbi:hypothetical protein LTR37_012470 [Vermiconidia calcicola]|uniref:Uncharacterized protein n=1 Tax=Vermiconidia calcicola TaxID=1690605 RepID=A0ACC3MZB5_9PEZI|nr:hypothetical protein LTR37_012470 [Vermiconidia calcicola]
MDNDPLSTFTTPPSKRRKLVSVQPSPPKLSELMAAFGAKQLPSSASRMDKITASKELRPQRPGVTYAESESSNSPTGRTDASSFDGSPVSSKTSVKLNGSFNSDGEREQSHDSDDELHSDDVIHVPRSYSTRELPNRSTRSRVSYASPKKPTKKKGVKGRKAIKPIQLTSDLTSKPASKAARVHGDTARNRVRNDIAEHTKPKRDAFLLVNKDYFMPLLPATSYIDKLQRIRDMNDDPQAEAVPYKAITTQPEGVKANIKPYQMEGLSFLVYMHKNGMSAILGDEMGLGKTLQTLSLFQWLKESEPTTGEHRPYLVVCPLSVLSSWMNEAKRWVPGLNAVRFHGPKTERERLKEDCRSAGKAAKFDIIVTTYETFVAEQGWFKRAFVWRYCVLDEGHKIKNEKSDVSHSIQSLSAEYRLLLTGTPLQNNLHEMWALLHWLYPEVFTLDTAEEFRQAFNLTKGQVSTTFMDDARRLLELIMLRRMKSSPGVNLGLPPKEEVLLYVPLTPMQRFWYTRFLTKVDTSMLEQLFKGAKTKEVQVIQQEAEEDTDQLQLLKKAEDELTNPNGPADDVWAESKEIMEKAVQNEQGDAKSSDWRKLMNLIMQLRKICSHPYLLLHAEPEPYFLGDHIKTASGKFIVLDKLLEELVVKQKKKILIFAGFTKTLNLCEDLLTMKGGNAVNDAAFRYLRLDGGTARARRNLGIRMFNDPKSEFKVMLISTRAGGLGINLASASDVVFMDEDWNPQITIQAEARAHRIGQTQKVTIYKLCTRGTVEEQMLGRIRKKLYLSAKITESMRNIHASDEQGKKRKRGPVSDTLDDDAPQLDTTSLKSLIRRGAQTLSRPEVDVTEMLKWDWETTLEKCKDKPMDAQAFESAAADVDEQSWLKSMEKVECAVFEGKKHQKQVEKAAKEALEFNRAIAAWARIRQS